MKGAFWPTRQQRLLLETALGDRTDAEAAWRELLPGLDLQTIEDGTFAALPLVYRALEAAVPDEPLLPRLKGMYRSTWARNTLLRERLAVSARVLESADVPFLLVVSIGAARRYYATLGLRPTQAIELLVRNDHVLAAVKALGSAGWAARGTGRASRADPLVLLDDGGNACLLNTALAPDIALSTPYGPLWDAATDLDEQGVRVTALAPTDDLLAAIVTGARTRPAPSLQWILDAAMIQRSVPDEIDWERLVAAGLVWGQGLRLREALEYLDGLPGVSVPADVRRRLGARRPGRRERIGYACSTRPLGRLGSLPQAVGEHLAETAGRTALATIASFPGFLRRRWSLERTRQVPLAGARRAYRVALRRRPEPVRHL
jgi:hypothetical protein